MAKTTSSQREAFPRSTKVLIWIAAVIAGAMLGLWVATMTKPFSPWSYLAYAFFPFFGSNVVIYRSLKFWGRANNEERESRNGLVILGILAAIMVGSFLRVTVFEIPLRT